MGEAAGQNTTARAAACLRDCDETVINQLKDAHILSDCII